MVKVLVQIPLLHNDGTPVPENVFKGFRELMLDEFGGWTKLPGVFEGAWRGEDGKRYEDSSYRYEIAIPETEVEHMKSIIRSLGKVTKQEAMYYEMDGKPDIMEIE